MNTEKKNKHMTLDDRIEIQECLNKGMTFKAIAVRIGKDPTIVSKEIKLHGKTHLKRMKQNSFEKNGGTYTLAKDCLIPNLVLPEPEPIGKWGLLRKHYLRENHRALYSSWILTGKLDEHLKQIEKDCEERFELITMQMAERENVTEGLKADDQMEWVRRMNSIWNRAEEIVLHEPVYV